MLITLSVEFCVQRVGRLGVTHRVARIHLRHVRLAGCERTDRQTDIETYLA